MIGGTGQDSGHEEGGYLKLGLPLGQNPKRVRLLCEGLHRYECKCMNVLF